VDDFEKFKISMKEVIKDILQIGRGKDLESEDVIKLL
jgi:hypothetical protein